MVVRELTDGRAIVATQEDHAELSAQFAAHWGNDRFSKLRPYRTMIFATTFHDSGYREFEGNPPMNIEKGRPFAHREEVPSFEAIELEAYAQNIAWVRSHDPYAGLLVSMHRTGLWHNRYNVFTQPSMRLRERSAEVQGLKKVLEKDQEQYTRELAASHADFEDELSYNYRALQIFDLLSLYFCCDGYASENKFKEYTIAPVRVAYGSPEEVSLRILPNGANGVRFDPYPFDISPLQVCVRARVIKPATGRSEEAALEAYQKAPRQMIHFQVAR
jgi:hypothetical protein